jgi:phosphoribosylformylglycinamidine cyclo-ligase
LEFHHTDGIGTKGIYHWGKRSFKNAILDALAMNLNDLAMVGATPYALIDHLFIPEDDDVAILEMIKYLSEECRKRNIAITGGETAIHNNIEGLELSVTMLGFIEKPKKNQFKINDVLIGIESNGIHSNGFTKVREIFGNELREDFIRPTNIYLDAILKLNKKFDIHGTQHITGGAFTKFKDLLESADILISKNHELEPQEIFKELYQRGISDDEMYKTFNCGIGFVLSVSEQDADEIISEIKNFKADVIGKVISGSGKIKIQSKFSDKEIEL